MDALLLFLTLTACNLLLPTPPPTPTPAVTGAPSVETGDTGTPGVTSRTTAFYRGALLEWNQTGLLAVAVEDVSRWTDLTGQEHTVLLQEDEQAIIQHGPDLEPVWVAKVPRRRWSAEVQRLQDGSIVAPCNPWVDAAGDTTTVDTYEGAQCIGTLDTDGTFGDVRVVPGSYGGMYAASGIDGAYAVAVGENLVSTAGWRIPLPPNNEQGNRLITLSNGDLLLFRAFWGTTSLQGQTDSETSSDGVINAGVRLTAHETQAYDSFLARIDRQTGEVLAIDQEGWAGYDWSEAATPLNTGFAVMGRFSDSTALGTGNPGPVVFEEADGRGWIGRHDDDLALTWVARLYTLGGGGQLTSWQDHVIGASTLGSNGVVDGQGQAHPGGGLRVVAFEPQGALMFSHQVADNGYFSGLVTHPGGIAALAWLNNDPDNPSQPARGELYLIDPR